MANYKKIFVLGILLLSAAGVVISAENTKFSRDFIKNFKDCDKYTESSESVFEGVSFKTTRKIIGWRNGFCKYEETMNSSLGDYVVRCSFPPIQVEEIYDSMRDRSKEPIRHNLEIFAKKTNPKTGEISYYVAQTQEIKGNKAYVTWAKYENSPYFCLPERVGEPSPGENK